MKLPKHIELSLSHNPQNSCYDSVADYLGIREADDDNWVSKEQRDKALQTGELWECQWYPVTPVGFCFLLACDLDALLAALAEAADTEKGNYIDDYRC